nr:glutathione reductase [Chlamydomonas sp. UWO 241]
MRSACLSAQKRLLSASGPRASRVAIHARSIAAMATPDKFDYDIFTIGAGSGGVRCSRISSGYGAKVAVCELPFEFISSETAGGVGGTCVLRGCVPKKLMVYASEYNEGFKDSEGFGWSPVAPSHSWTTFMDAKRKELTRLNNAYKNTLSGAKVELMEGRGKIVGPHEVDVDGKRYTAKNIVIAVGGRPTKLNIPGADLCITSDEALELADAPKKITVLGGGYIAVEFSGIFARFGCETHTVYRQPLPLRGFDEECRKFLGEQYAVAGLHLHPETNPVEVKKQPNGKLTIVIKHHDGRLEEIADNDAVMMATGRSPNVSNLGLESVGVATGPGGTILVDDYSRTNVPSVWAVGDVTNRIQLTPVALMEGMALARTIVLNEPTKPNHLAVASAVFSNPELATVGISEEDAMKQYKNVDVYTSSFRAMRNTISGNPLRSFMKIVVDADTDKLLGMHMIGAHAAEIMQGFAVCVKQGLTKAQIDDTIGIHPSSAEEFVTMRAPSRKIRDGKVVA